MGHCDLRLSMQHGPRHDYILKVRTADGALVLVMHYCSHALSLSLLWHTFQTFAVIMSPTLSLLLL